MIDYFPEKPWACKCGCGYDKINPELVRMLNEAREMANTPFVITSACRCEKHNKEEGGKPNSAHLTGEAVDIQAIDGKSKFIILSSLLDIGFERVGIGKTFIHADTSTSLPFPTIWLYGS